MKSDGNLVFQSRLGNCDVELRDANNQGTRYDRAIAVFKKHGGLLRTAQALRAGIHPGTIYEAL